MSTEDKLIQLGLISPKQANTVQEFIRLRELTTDRQAHLHLTSMIDGMLQMVDNAAQGVDEILSPLGIKSSTHINTIDVAGYPTSVWATNNFIARLRFLYTGRIAVVYTPGHIVPLCVRADVDELVDIKRYE